ncbi:MAG: protein kinase [Synergistaceae bacterium]|jgi:serine/threonine protein kinase|nr:protein kinase [Synergistaceae bacterium]
MADIKQYEPLWGSWYIESPIGEGSFGRVYRVKKEEFGKAYYSAVKVLSIPQNESDLRRAKNDGLDEVSARSYFHSFVTDIIQEIDLMSAFRGNSNIVSLEDHKVIERENEIGWDILIRMELLTSLSDHVTKKPLDQDEVLKLGVHICRALELCAVKRTIHRDVKPDNIFVSPYGEYKLGDFGIARQIERTMSGMSKKGTYTYMAPEVFKGEEYGASVDTYSLGIVMYRFLNQNRTPFLPGFPAAITPKDRDDALQRRMSGEPLPPIEGIDPALSAIVLKACAYDRKARFADATEMRKTLESVAGGRSFAPIASARTVAAPPEAASKTATAPQAPTVPPADVPAERTEGSSLASMTKSERTEGVFTSRPGFGSGTVGRSEASVHDAKAPAWVTRNLSVSSGITFGILCALCWLGDAGTGVLVFLPAYVLCVVQCILKFRNKYVNVFFLSMLALYLSASCLINLVYFDYNLFIVTLGLITLVCAGDRPAKYGRAVCFVLIACSLAAGGLVAHSTYGIREAYQDFVVGAAAMPILTLFVSILGLAMLKRDGAKPLYAVSGIIAAQFFPVIAFALHFIGSLFRGVSPYANVNSLFYMADTNFIGISPGRFPWWQGWRFPGFLIQLCAAFVPFFLLALAELSPNLFARVFDRSNRKKLLLSVAGFAIAIAIAAKVLSLALDAFLAGAV